MNSQLSDHTIQSRNSVPKRQMRELVRLRTSQLACLAGRTPDQITQADYERAKREITGETDFDCLHPGQLKRGGTE